MRWREKAIACAVFARQLRLCAVTRFFYFRLGVTAEHPWASRHTKVYKRYIWKPELIVLSRLHNPVVVVESIGFFDWVNTKYGDRLQRFDTTIDLQLRMGAVHWHLVSIGNPLRSLLNCRQLMNSITTTQSLLNRKSMWLSHASSVIFPLIFFNFGMCPTVKPK